MIYLLASIKFGSRDRSERAVCMLLGTPDIFQRIRDSELFSDPLSAAIYEFLTIPSLMWSFNTALTILFKRQLHFAVSLVPLALNNDIHSAVFLI